MADIPTVILGLTKPDVDVEDSVDWGDKLNANFDLLDTQWGLVVPSPITLGAAGAAGTDTHVARADHVHAMASTLPPIAGLSLTGDLDMNGFDILEWLDASIPPAAAADTATGGRNRIAQILNQIKVGFGLTNWYDLASGLINRVTANEASIVTLQATDTTQNGQIAALQSSDITQNNNIATLTAQQATTAAAQSLIDRLRPTSQATPNATVLVAAGVYTKSDGSATVTFAGGSSPAFSVVTANSRIDLLTIDDTGTVGITQGTQAASPVPPAYPPTRLVLAEVTISQTTGPTVSNVMIKDVRPYLNLGSGGGSGSGSGTMQYVAYTVGTATGSYSGSLTAFVLPFSYTADGKTLAVYYNGQQLRVGVDYTETSTSQITTTSPLIAGAAVWFRAISASVVSASTVTLYREDYIVGTPLNTYTGSLTVFNLGNSYNLGGNAIVVTLDGDVQTKGASADYLETNSLVITFNTPLVVGQRVSLLWSQTAAAGGTVNAGTVGQLPYYAASGSTVSGTDAGKVGSGGNLIVKGTTTNDSAAPGMVGEYVEAVFAAIASGATGVFTDSGNIPLTAGDWDVTFNCLLSEQTGTGGGTWWDIGISQTPGNSTLGLLLGSNWSSLNGPGNNVINANATIAAYRISLSGSATIYAKTAIAFTTGTWKFYGRLSARRVR